MSVTTEFVLYGASGHGMVIAEILELRKEAIACFVDANPAIVQLLDYPVYHQPDQVPVSDSKHWIVSIGHNRTRKKVVAQLDVHFGTAIHPSAQLSPRASIGDGTVVMAGVSVNSSAVIGRHCILNTGSNIDHECVLEDYVHISPGASLAGNVTVGEGSHIGTGASVIPGVRIGKWCIIGAGAAVIRDVPDYATVVGVPARIIKTESIHE
jgi:acetyltransferase EpsM